jgi:hypothetical protein
MLPCDFSQAGANGAADAVAVNVSGIKTGDELMAVISWEPGGDPAPVDTTDFTVGDGTITAATIDTTDKLLWVIWHESRD